MKGHQIVIDSQDDQESQVTVEMNPFVDHRDQPGMINPTRDLELRKKKFTQQIDIAKALVASQGTVGRQDVQNVGTRRLSPSRSRVSLSHKQICLVLDQGSDHHTSHKILNNLSLPASHEFSPTPFLGMTLKLNIARWMAISKRKGRRNT